MSVDKWINYKVLCRGEQRIQDGEGVEKKYEKKKNKLSILIFADTFLE